MNVETVGSSIERTQVLLLAGGRGTRLRSAFRAGPKSMAPVAGRPFLEYLLVWLRAAGFKRFVMCVGHKKRQIQNWLGDGSHWQIDVQYSEEKALLGTGGALKKAEKLISSPRFLVVNGDSFADTDLRRMYHFHLQRRASATIALTTVEDPVRYGAVFMNRKKQILAFKEKNIDTLSHKLPALPPALINAGVYLFQRQVLNAIPARKKISLEKQIFPALIQAGLYGFVTRGYFIDIGLPSDFHRAQTELPGRINLDHPR